MMIDLTDDLNPGHAPGCPARFGDGDCDEVEPRCDICGEPDGPGEADWNGDTGNHATCEAEAARPIRTYQLGDRVTVRGGAFGGEHGTVRQLHHFTPDGEHDSPHRNAAGVTVYVEVAGIPALPFAPSELDYAEVGDLIAADMRALGVSVVS